MKIQHKDSKQVIDVPNDHASMLMTQGWKEYVEQPAVKEVVRESEEKEQAQDNGQKEVLKRGRPKRV